LDRRVLATVRKRGGEQRVTVAVMTVEADTPSTDLRVVAADSTVLQEPDGDVVVTVGRVLLDAEVQDHVTRAGVAACGGVGIGDVALVGHIVHPDARPVGDVAHVGAAIREGGEVLGRAPEVEVAYEAGP